MGLERRGNRIYYYRKRRVGDRVISEYVGGGQLAHTAKEMDDIDATKKRIAMDGSQQALEKENMLTDQIGHAFAGVDRLLKAEMLRLGYHQHSRTWRRRRND
jgi:hypothetical protein